MQQTCKYIYVFFLLVFTATIVGMSLGHKHHPSYNQESGFWVDAPQAYDCLACHFVALEPQIDDQNLAATPLAFESILSFYGLVFVNESRLSISRRGPPLLA